MAIKVDYPPTLSGTPEAKVNQLSKYLFRLSEALNMALNNLTADNFAAEAREELLPEGLNEATSEAIKTQYTQLRDLIVKTADTVTASMDTFEMELQGKYVAISDYGKFVEDTNLILDLNSRGIQQYYEYWSETAGATSSNTSFITAMQTYIRSGLLDDSNQASPIYGVEIGELGEQKFKVRITAARISFYIATEEVAYISNNKLFITTANITSSLMLGKWSIDSLDGLTIKWKG